MRSPLPIRRSVSLRPALRAVGGGLCVCLLLVASARAQKPACTLPSIATKQWDGSVREIAENDLCGFQRFPREEFARKDAPDEMFVLAEESVLDFLCVPYEPPRTLWQFSLYGREGELRCYANSTRERRKGDREAARADRRHRG